MIDPNKIQALSAQVLEYAKKLGATQADVGFSVSKGLSVNVRLGDVETVEFNEGRSLAVSVYNGLAKGNASTNDDRWETVKQTVEHAWAIAKHTEIDPAAGLPEKDLLAFQYPDLDLYHPCEVEAEKAIQIAKACEQSALDADPKIKNSEGSSVDCYESYNLLANSLGFCGDFKTTRYGVSCSVIAKDHDHMEREYEFSVNRRFDELWPVEKIGVSAAKKAVARLNSQKIKTCKVPVIFLYDVARGIFSHFLGAISGGNLYRQSSFLLNSLHTHVLSEVVSITEAPHLLRGLGSAPFDGEGVKTSPNTIVTRGAVDRYILSTYSARKLGMQTTGNAGGTHNVLVQSTGQSFDELLNMLGTGFLITEVMGQGVNIVTGDYSRGAAGFWVENGKIAYPVSEVTVSSTLQHMLKGIQAIGTDVDLRSSLQTGSILIDEMVVAGA